MIRVNPAHDGIPASIDNNVRYYPSVSEDRRVIIADAIDDPFASYIVIFPYILDSFTRPGDCSYIAVHPNGSFSYTGGASLEWVYSNECKVITPSEDVLKYIAQYTVYDSYYLLTRKPSYSAVIAAHDAQRASMYGSPR